ncbi:GerW family sporulation protein [Sporolactobacillus vineae]|uniref:GerW family sporulation protein n=1 Tax=Sporolactobacillus vineae TaxID=444463 RepID=UPI000287B884|nr:GerW family sporulation protein [Sporolactobacillus vineae]
MADHPIQGLMKTALESLRSMTDVRTIIGEPIRTEDGHLIITISKVGFGFVAGGSEFNTQNENQDEDPSEETEAYLPFGGGAGGGVSITPIAFLIIGPRGVKTIHLDNRTHLYERVLDLTPQTIEKIKDVLEQAVPGRNSKQKADVSRRKDKNRWYDEDD